MTIADNKRPLTELRLPELRIIAAERGLRGVSGLRKGDLIAVIEGRMSVAEAKKQLAAAEEAPQATGYDSPPAEPRSVEPHTRAHDSSESASTTDSDQGSDGAYESRSAARRARRNRAKQLAREEQRGHGERAERGNRDGDPEEGGSGSESDAASEGQPDGDRGYQQNGHNQGAHNGNRPDRRGRRGRRNRRNRPGHGGGSGEFHNENGNTGSDAPLEPVAGIVDIVDNSVAFVRTTGYRASSSDVFVSNQLVRRCGLRSGDAVTGLVKPGATQTRGHGRNRQKYTSLVRVETVNGVSVEEARQRPHFSNLTPLYPNKRLRLETERTILTTRVIDLIMPIGKGQRALIVSPPKAGKTTILQNIANAIAKNNPECHLMVVLVDERPEEVTDMERSVNGEVIASTFDRPPSEHTAVAELAIERAKRLVEDGRDVVVLLDSITRLGRAYNNSSPASGRILSGGVDSNALYPPKRFLGAARNIEHGGSLTIIATAMVETGSAGDTVIFEEFKGTGNAELKLDRKIAERRVFPAVDVGPSGTRKDELLLAPEEAKLMHKLRRVLAALDNQQAIDLVIRQLKKTKNNAEFLMQVASSAPMAAGRDEEDYS